MFIKDSSVWINVDIACVLFSLSRSSYYVWLANEQKPKINPDAELEQSVRDIFTASHGRYGVDRVINKLAKTTSKKYSYKKISKIMQRLNLHAIGAKKYKATTNSKHKNPVFENLLARQFNVDKPNLAWVGDITYIHTNEGWLYLATVIDLFSRKVIGHHTSDRMTTDLVTNASHKALRARKYPKNVIMHTDRGSQYASKANKAFMLKYKVIGSMSRKGDCWDNACAESFFATIKKEYIRNTTFTTRIKAQLGIFDYIEAWYNNERIHSKLAGLSPVEFERLNRPEFKNQVINNQENGVRLNY